MAIGHSERQSEGVRAEKLAAKILSELGYHVEMPPAITHDWDLKVNGHEIDVKAAVRTTSRGSDGNPITGYVFTNLHKPAKVDFYLLLCLDPKRTRVIDFFLLPAKAAPARTITITPDGKYAPYNRDLAPLDKTAASIATSPWSGFVQGNQRTFGALRGENYRADAKAKIVEEQETSVFNTSAKTLVAGGALIALARRKRR